MSQVVLATVDAVYGPVIAEALGEAGIEVVLAPVAALQQFQVQQQKVRPMVDVHVDGDREREARLVLERLEAESEEAATVQSEQASPEAKAAAQQLLEGGSWLPAWARRWLRRKEHHGA